MANCPHCSVAFLPGKPWAKYCSRRCGNLARMKAYRNRRKSPKVEQEKNSQA